MTTSEVDPAVVELSRRLLPRADELAAGMVGLIRSEIASYANDELVGPEDLHASCVNNMRFVLGQLAGEPVGADAPRRTGVARAEIGVPYADVLRAFRVGSRYIWETLVAHADADVRERLLLAAAQVWEVSDDLSEQVTEAFRAVQADAARRDAQKRAALLGQLLEDLTGAEQSAEAATILGLPRTGEFVLVTAECPAPGEEALPMAETLLMRRGVVSVWRLEHDLQEGLVVLRRGFRVPELLAALSELARGRVGVSAVCTRLDHGPAALTQARLACRAATVGVRDVVFHPDRPLGVLLATTGGQAAVFATAVLGPVLDLGEEDARVLTETARVWLDVAGSTSGAAALLFIHRNTVRYRMRRLQELTGRDLSVPVQAAEVHVALECLRISGLLR